jgi:hypothetical protein
VFFPCCHCLPLFAVVCDCLRFSSLVCDSLHAPADATASYIYDRSGISKATLATIYKKWTTASSDVLYRRMLVSQGCTPRC